MMTKITAIKAREIIDSRGNPTIEAEVWVGDVMGRAAVPSGASTGEHEAVELRDRDPKRYAGLGVLKAIHHIETILAPALIGKSVHEQAAIDQQLIDLDGTENKAHLGANALLAVSLANAHASAKINKLPLYRNLSPENKTYILPVPMMNILNGGAHANNNIDLQEFMIVPVGAPTFSEALRYGVEVFHVLQKLLKEKKFNTAVGDEGGFAPDLANNEAALDLVMKAITVAGYEPGKDIYIALDLASSEFYQNNQYFLRSQNKLLDAGAWLHYLRVITSRYPIISIEDAMAENDWDGFKLLTETFGHKMQLVGDDLFVTNTRLLKRGIDEHACNAILIKPNQIGTLTETLAAIQLAKENKFATVMSHRSGETEDTTIADLAVATGCGQIKTGSLCRSERLAKYNQLLRIERELGSQAVYLGGKVFACLA